MTPKNLLHFFDELIEEPEKYSSVEELTSKSLSLFNSLVASIQEASDEERLKIQQELQEVSSQMNEKFEGLCQKFGISRDQLESLMNDPSHFNSEIWSSMEALKHEIHKSRGDLLKTLNPEYAEAEPVQNEKKKKASKKEWITI
jgi:hypothetical protein